MYSIVFHAHQKIDKVAYRHLVALLPKRYAFPTLAQILDFEGRKGPDSAKLKQRPEDQPWHFIIPSQAKADDELVKSINHHHQALAKALKDKDETKAAFEAAWLAHAVVDGLTPAHHYPYEQILVQLRGEPRETRRGLLGRIYVKGDNLANSLLRSLKLVGPKGLLTTHTAFEAGAFVIMAPLTLKKGTPNQADLDELRQDGFTEVYLRALKEIDDLKIYDRFIYLGWTHSVGRDVRQELAPKMAKMVTLAWLSAAEKAL